MDYDMERSKQEEAEIRKTFRELFPLAAETDLPWAACHIKGFLRKRLEHETEERVFHFTSQIVRVLCEVSPPKTHAVDMARIVVDQAKESAGLAKELMALRNRVKKLEEGLTQSVALQSHYAELLNATDGGTRMVFADSKAWLARLKEVAEQQKGAAAS